MQRQDASEPIPDPPSRGPAPATLKAPTPVLITVKEEETQHLPPVGSVDNPVEIDDSGDDETVVQGPVVKRRMKGM